MAAAYVLEDGGKLKRRALMESFARNSRMARSNTVSHFRKCHKNITCYHVLIGLRFVLSGKRRVVVVETVSC